MIVLTGCRGQLANRIHVFAHFIAFSAEHRVRIANPCFSRYSVFFEAFRRDPLCRFPLVGARLPQSAFVDKSLDWIAGAFDRFTKLPLLRAMPFAPVGTRNSYVVDISSPSVVARLTEGRLLLVDGWFFRNSRNLIRHAESIREVFTPATEMLGEIEATMKRARYPNKTLVGVHIRQGDYKTWKGGRYFFDASQYVSLVRSLVEARGDSLSFLVCSDEVQDASLFAGLPVSFGPGHPLKDMYALSDCDLIIGPPSSYTQWASFFGNVPLYAILDASVIPAPGDFHVWPHPIAGADLLS